MFTALVLFACGNQSVATGSIYSSLIHGNYDSAQRLHERVGSLKHPIGSSDFEDVITMLVRNVNDDGHYKWVLTGVRWCSERGADVNALEGRPLATAASDPHHKVLARLLEYGAKPNLVPKGWDSALVTASRTGRLPNVLSLLEHGADAKVPGGKSGTTALSESARGGHFRIAEELVKAKANVNWRNPTTGRTALHEAAANDHSTVVELLLEHGASKSIRDKSNLTPLALARKAKADLARKALGG